MEVSKNAVVTLNYKLTSDSGDLLDSSEGGDPLVYIHGTDSLIPGLEKELEGKAGGAAFKVRIDPEQAYGLRHEGMIQDVPRDQLPDEIDIEVGMQFQAEGDHIVTVVEVGDDSIRMDGNHPLAGVALNFDVSVVDVRTATDEEIQHGHVHGAGGHEH